MYYTNMLLATTIDSLQIFKIDYSTFIFTRLEVISFSASPGL